MGALQPVPANLREAGLNQGGAAILTHGHTVREEGAEPVGIASPNSPVRPTLLRHMKHLFFLGLGVSPFPSSLLEAATGVELEAAGWLTTTEKGKKNEGFV